MIARHLPIVETEIGLDHWPNLYCGVAVLLFFLLYLGCRQIRVREKAVYCGLLLLFMASFSINVLNFIWPWVSLSQQSSMQTVLYLHFPGAAGKL